MSKAIKSAGSAFGGIAGTAAGSILGNQISGAVGGQQPAPGLRRIGTGRSTFERTGSNNNALDIAVDPRINRGQENFLNAVRGFRAPVNTAFNTFQEELGGIRDDVAGLESDFRGNESAFRAASMAPLQERIAKREGTLATELARTDVKGAFKNAELTKFQLDAGRELSNQEARIEQERIQNLSSLLGMDATLIQQGLTSEQGRINMLMSLEQSLAGVSTERFNQEMQLLSQGSGIGVTPLQQLQGMNQQGIFAGLATEGIGSILGSFGGGSTVMPPGAVTSGSAAGGI